MNVASLELCKELYELSGWQATAKYRKNGFLVTWGYMRLKGSETPAYDLGYLMRKLPIDCVVCQVSEPIDGVYWFAGGMSGEYDVHLNHFKAVTPEDAAAKLAIEMFKEGVLTRGRDERLR
jgi:hypothetical protein